MDKSKSIYRAAGHYHWVLLTFIIVIIIIVIINDIWFVYLSIFIANKFILTTVNKNFSYFKSFKILLTCRISPPEVFSRRGGDVLRMCWGFPGVYLCMAVILIKLQSGFVEIALLCWCSPVGFLHFWEHLPWRTPLEDCFWTEIILYTILNLFFLIKYTFEDFEISVFFVILIRLY